MLDEGGKAMSADGIKESENYDKLEQSLADIRKDVGSLQEISVGRLHFEIEWFLGGGLEIPCLCLWPWCSNCNPPLHLVQMSTI